MPFFSIIIVNYNGRKCLELCLPSILRQTYQDFEIIIVDNGSNDNSVEYVQSKFKSIRILKNKHNSFSSGNNLGIHFSQGKYIFILNNDVELDINCLDKLAEAVNDTNTNVGMWATKIYNFYSRNIFDSTGLLVYGDGLCRGRGRLETDTGQFKMKEEVFCPSGCAALYKKSMLDDIGLFDEDFEFYLEDTDLGIRARLKGWRCFFIPQAIVYHQYSTTSGKYSSFKAYLIERNRIWLVVKDFPFLIIINSCIYTLKRYLYQAVSVFTHRGAAGEFKGKMAKSKLFLILCKSWLFALTKIFTMLKKRKYIQHSSKVSLKEIHSWFSKFRLSVQELTFKK